MPKHVAKHMLGHRTKHEAKAEVSRICTRPSQGMVFGMFLVEKMYFPKSFLSDFSLKFGQMYTQMTQM